MCQCASSWQYVLAIGAPFDLFRENLLDGLNRMDAILGAFFTKKALGLLARNHGAVIVILAVFAAMNDTTVLSVDILLLFGDAPYSGCFKLPRH